MNIYKGKGVLTWDQINMRKALEACKDCYDYGVKRDEELKRLQVRK